MKTVLSLFAITLIMFTATAQNKKNVASANIIKEKRLVKAFEKIDVNGAFIVLLTNDTAGAITVEASDNIAPLITTKVNNGTLKINFEKKNWSGNKGKMIVRVPFIALSEVKLTGSGSIESEKLLTGDVKIKLDGSGSILLNIVAQQTDSLIIGSGTITLKGSSPIFNGNVIGSGAVIASNFNSDVVGAKLNGSGNLKVMSKKSIIGRLTGSGYIAYSGDPKTKDLDASGSGSFSTY